MTTALAVQPWPGPVPALRDGLFVIMVRTGGGNGTQRDNARRQIRQATCEALAAVLNLAPDAIRIESSPGRPPRIVVDGDARGIGCSFAHEDMCDDSYALAAVNLHGAVGVDLMRVREIPDWEAVAHDYLGPAVSAALAATPTADRPRALAQAWTRREAGLKCHGQQLSEWRAEMVGSTTALAIPATGLIGHIHTGDKQ